MERQAAIDFALLTDASNGNRGESQKRIADAVVQWAALMLRKNADYGCAVWDPPMLAPKCDAGTAILVRMSDKLSRLVSLQGKEAEVSESVDDTIRDLGAYCLLLLARPKPDAA